MPEHQQAAPALRRFGHRTRNPAPIHVVQEEHVSSAPATHHRLPRARCLDPLRPRPTSTPAPSHHSIGQLFRCDPIGFSLVSLALMFANRHPAVPRPPGSTRSRSSLAVGRSAPSRGRVACRRPRPVAASLANPGRQSRSQDSELRNRPGRDPGPAVKLPREWATVSITSRQRASVSRWARSDGGRLSSSSFMGLIYPVSVGSSKTPQPTPSPPERLSVTNRRRAT